MVPKSPSSSAPSSQKAFTEFGKTAAGRAQPNRTRPFILIVARCFSHLILLIAVQPRNSTTQCIFLAYFTPQVLPFPMPRLVPTKPTAYWGRIVTPHHPPNPYSVFLGPVFSSFYKSLLPPARSHRFLFASFSSVYKSLFGQGFCFHIYTKPPGVATSIPEFTIFAAEDIASLLSSYYADSLSSRKTSSALESATSGLFGQKHPGGWGGSTPKGGLEIGVRPALSAGPHRKCG